LFTRELYDMTLTNDIANRLFNNITASGFGSDRTFTATLRAVLHKRLPTDKTLHLAMVPLANYCMTADMITESICQNDLRHTYAIYIVYPQDKQYGNQMIESVRSGIGKGKQYLDTYSLQEDLRLFYIKKMDGLFYTNSFSTIIFVDYLDIRRLHALQMMIPKYVPELFANNPLTLEETELLKSLGLRGHSEYERLIEAFARTLDMRNEIIRTRLQGFETVFEREQVTQLTREIEIYRRDYQTMLTNLRNTSNTIQSKQILLSGLQSKINDEHESELMDYFLCNKQLSVIYVEGTSLEFVVHGYADVFNEEAFDTCVNNMNSYLYKNIGSGITKEEMQKLYLSVFGENGTYKLRMCAAYRADMKNSITPIMDYAFPPESKNYLPNPHVQEYGCIGSYASRFMEYMHNNRDYVGAINQASLSARNLNFYDSTVMASFVSTLSATTVRCIEDSDGSLMTPKEAIKRMEGAEIWQKQSE